MSADVFAVVIAALALALTSWQWLESRRSERIRLLLGEKEAVAYEAMSIVASGSSRASQRTVRALIGAALFEGSDRARLVVYSALGQLEQHRGQDVRQALSELVEARRRYGHAVDAATFDRRLEQLHTALPWTALTT